MIHARKDYNRIQDLAAVMLMLKDAIREAATDDTIGGEVALTLFAKHLEERYGPLEGVQPIPEDELVFLVRAKDQVAPDTVRYWGIRADHAGAAPHMVKSALQHADAMEARQRQYGYQIPDMPED